MRPKDRSTLSVARPNLTPCHLKHHAKPRRCLEPRVPSAKLLLRRRHPVRTLLQTTRTLAVCCRRPMCVLTVSPWSGLNADPHKIDVTSKNRAEPWQKFLPFTRIVQSVRVLHASRLVLYPFMFKNLLLHILVAKM